MVLIKAEYIGHALTAARTIAEVTVNIGQAFRRVFHRFFDARFSVAVANANEHIRFLRPSGLSPELPLLIWSLTAPFANENDYHLNRDQFYLYGGNPAYWAGFAGFCGG